MGKIQPTITSFAYPTEMPDDLATRLGLKIYEHGGSYNGGGAPTITSTATNIASVFGQFIPYQMQDGSWRIRFNLSFSHDSTTSHTITIAGVVFSSTPFQPIPITLATGNAVVLRGQVAGGTSNLTAEFASGQTSTRISGDVLLESKPTWAY